MKKYLSAFWVLALVVGCSKENIAPVQSSNEVLLTSYAGQPQTKTTIAGNKTDGFTANWAADDAIGVYTTAGTANAKPQSLFCPTERQSSRERWRHQRTSKLSTHITPIQAARLAILRQFR